MRILGLPPVRVALAAAVALACLAAPALAAPDGTTVVVNGTGRATELDLIARTATGLVVVEPTTVVAGSTPVAYGFGAAAPDTVDLSRYGLPTRAARSRQPGMVAVLRTDRGLFVEGEAGIGRRPRAIGYVYPQTAAPRLLAVRSAAGAGDPTVVESNLDAGGAVWSWTYRGVQYVNGFDLGRQIQSALWNQTGGRIYNPNEAGDEWSSVQRHETLRHGSPVASASTSGTTQSTRSIPLEWNPASVTTAAETTTPVLWQDVRLGKDLTVDHLGMAGVARYRTVVTVPQGFHGHLEMPTAYLRGEFDTFHGVDAVSGQRTPLAPVEWDPLLPTGDPKLEYLPASGRGGVIASTADGQHAMGIYGVTTAAGGQVTSFAVHDFAPDAWVAVPGFGNGQFDFSTAKIRAERGGWFPQGTSTYEAFVVTGTVDEVVARMQALAARS